MYEATTEVIRQDLHSIMVLKDDQENEQYRKTKSTNPLDIFFINSDVNPEAVELIVKKYKFDVARPCRDESGNLGPSF